ncbi:MAG TPA: amidase family protein [Steroidobacteraceae bacterium]|nr:amidase family protein [Steroidobacteraceae bacterium]
MNPYATATQIIESIRAGTSSATDWLELYIQRRLSFNGRINAIVSSDDEAALAQARAIDAAVRSGGEPGALCGLPVTVKDGINLRGLPSTGGMLEPAAAIASEDAPTVRSLRAAGAVLLGKTNVPVGNSDWQADNPVFGRSNNPWNPLLTPGGSTGGGAAAVAAGLSAAELGSDIGGSIRIPAAFCGVFGHKPSLTALPRSGHFPRGNVPNPGQVLGVQGPLTRSAGDLEALLGTMLCPDGLEGKGWHLALPQARFDRFADCRVGVLGLPGWLPVEDSILGALEDLCSLLASRGARLLDLDVEPHFGDLRQYYRDYLELLQCSLAGALPPDKRTRAARKMRGYGDEFLDAVADGLEADAGRMLALLERTERSRSQWERIFDEVDVVLSPVCSSNAFTHDDGYFYDRVLEVNREPMPYYRLSALPALASFAGLPATVFPTGRFDARGAPVGLQAMGAYLEDLTTIRFAALVETEQGGFVAPSVELLDSSL